MAINILSEIKTSSEFPTHLFDNTDTFYLSGVIISKHGGILVNREPVEVKLINRERFYSIAMDEFKNTRRQAGKYNEIFSECFVFAKTGKPITQVYKFSVYWKPLNLTKSYEECKQLYIEDANEFMKMKVAKETMKLNKYLSDNG